MWLPIRIATAVLLTGVLCSAARSQGYVTYCTGGTSSSGCVAALSTLGTASATAPSGFFIQAGNAEGSKLGIFFFGTGGRMATPWGNPQKGCSSWLCVRPPTVRTPTAQGTGTQGACDGFFQKDMNAYWTQKPQYRPPQGSLVQMQLWHRDPWNPCTMPNYAWYHTTGLSHGIEFTVGP